MRNVSCRSSEDVTFSTHLSGFAPAVPTPFDENGALDIPAFERFCDRQIQHGATALVVCGTTGEAPTLSRDEHDRIIRIAVDVAHGRVPVIAARDPTRQARRLNWRKTPRLRAPTPSCRSCRITTSRSRPACTRISVQSPSRPAFRSFFTTCRRGQCAASRMRRLRGWPRTRKFIGLKDATGDVTRPLRLRAMLGTDFRLLSGDDSTVLAFLAQGGDGCISVTSNVAPGLCRKHVPGAEARPNRSSPAPCGRFHEIDARTFQRDQSGAAQICAQPAETHVAAGSLAAC